ncbi:IPT/TIG domain-containing protein [Chitinophaga barathri]|uniref:IPT/TIG domain-containing protein n=1 Tax=Chitinophaga barathri TaxID=1647451 RepID=A0A3N4MP33_9BACT|nr:IPT/TIG domain-containing protein [Chitinophaga barathri]RPD41429.1 hypothetical protein EG028_08910 [Chitinophaga barathri]
MNSYKDGSRRLNRLWLAVLLLASFACKKNEDRLENAVALTITEFYPNSGKAGTLLTIEGEGFSGKIDQNTVLFGSVPGEVVAVDTAALIVRAPKDGQTGMVTVNNGSQTREVGTYTYQTLSISRIDPANGPRGSHIRIYGAGFSSITEPAKVMINGKAATIANANDTLLVAEVPEEAGSGAVEVNVDGMSTKGQNFLFQAIRQIKPLSGGTGTKVRIRGEGFESAVSGNLVDFNGKRAVVLEAMDTSLLVQAPEGVETGPLSVTINGQHITGPEFAMVPLPQITEVSPLSGPAGVEMIIKGQYFSTERDENHVFINNKEVAVTSASREELKLILPGGTGDGKVKVMVNDQQVEGPNFKDQNLGIITFSPDNGQDGLQVTITGSGFNLSPAANQVTFNGSQAQVLEATATTLKVLAPAGVTTGVVQVTVAGQVAVAPREFRRTGMETIASGITNVHSMTVDATGTIYAISGHSVVKVSPQGAVTVIAGDETQSGRVDGTGTEARFNFSNTSSIVMDNQHNLYVSERANNVIRKISPSGTVTEFVALALPGKMVMTPGNAIVAEAGTNASRISPQGAVTRLVPSRNGLLSVFWVTHAVDENGGIYFSDQYYQYDNQNIGYANPVSGAVTLNFWAGGGPYGSVDGIGAQASFTSIIGMVADGNGNLLVADATYNNTRLIRGVRIADRKVTTWFNFPRGSQDGPLYEAKVDNINSLTVAPNGDLYFYDQFGSPAGAIRKIFLR